MDRNILLSPYTAMRNIGVYAKRGWERTQERVLEKARTLHKPLQNELTTDVWVPAVDND